MNLGLLNIQPSEPMKLALILILAKVLSKYSSKIDLKKLIIPGLITILPFAFTVKQPDLGTAMVFLLILASLLLIVGVERKILVSSLLVGVVALPIAWNFGLEKYQKERVLTFLNPSRDPMGAGYNSNQSKVAIGSGQLYGKGFHKGTQSQLAFLPERHTDFIFSVLSEEHGFVGSVITIALFVILLMIGLKIASQAKDKQSAIMVSGCVIMIFIHVAINIGMVLGLLPIVGIPLPLLSYGGSTYYQQC